jgi:hypothetical protein
VYEESVIRQALISSCHSSKEAVQYFSDRIGDPALLDLLVRIAVDDAGHEGDAPMQAAYFASQFSGEELVRYEPALLALLGTANGYGGHVAVALGKTRSPRGRAAITAELGDGSRFDAWLFKKALAEYGDA